VKHDTLPALWLYLRLQALLLLRRSLDPWPDERVVRATFVTAN
jgi:hypothetical protein